jgi:hypothetical protein
MQADGESVGYGRPPQATRFKPGHSGNPKGRPKGSRNVRSELTDLLRGKVTVNDGGRRRNVTRIAAVVYSQWLRAVKGDERATQALIKFAETLGLFEKSEASVPLRWWTDEMIEQLNDEELDQFIRLNDKRQALLSACAPAERARTH